MARENGGTKRTLLVSPKTIALFLTLVLAVGGVVGGTVAWLIAKPAPVINTFTYGDINIELDETDTELDDDDNDKTNQYKMLPGQEITKDPMVTVKSGSEDMWLFVKLDESDNFDEFMEYEVNDTWEPLEDEEGVFYRHITAAEVADADMEIQVIEDNTVTVKETVTKEMLNVLDEPGKEANYPKLTVTAYAIQHTGISTAELAWEKIEEASN